MRLEETLKKAVALIRSGVLNNEAGVKLSVILPILRALDWEDDNPDEIRPDVSIAGGKVDYLLLRRHGEPLAFMKIRRSGSMDAADEKYLFAYASKNKIPFVILTDGNLWDFYLSTANGTLSERRFYRAELKREERISEYVESLEIFLFRSRVVSGEARRAAEQRLRERWGDAMLRAWRKLVDASNRARGERLRNLLTEEVEDECGTRPHPDDVKKFLKGLIPDVPPPPPPPPPPPKLGELRLIEKNSKIIGFILDGKRVETGVGSRTLAEVIKKFARRDSGFMERFAAQTVSKSKQGDGTPIQRLVARNRQDINVRPDLAVKHSRDLENGWWLGTCRNMSQIRNYIKIACEIAGVKFSAQFEAD